MEKRRGGLHIGTVVLAVAVTGAGLSESSGQDRFSRGQNLVPTFEGWEANTDGTFNMVFGYLNRNYEEMLDLPIGPNNNLEPGGPDQGQPTHFLPRRNRYVFRVKVPQDFGTKELVWTLTAHGKTEHAYATLKPEYLIDNHIVMTNNGVRNIDSDDNKPPSIRMDGDLHKTVAVGEPITLTAFVSDDGVPKSRRGRRRTSGLRVAWFVYRGPAAVSFDPEQFKVYPDFGGNSPFTPGWTPPPVPADGKYLVRATFTQPEGLCPADDGSRRGARQHPRCDRHRERSCDERASLSDRLQKTPAPCGLSCTAVRGAASANCSATLSICDVPRVVCRRRRRRPTPPSPGWTRARRRLLAAARLDKVGHSVHH